MTDFQTLFLVSVSCFIAGAIASALFTQWLSPSQRKNRDIAKHLHDKQQELKQHQLRITEHFVESASLLNKMADSYCELHNHLAEGARTLTAQGKTTAPLIDKISAFGVIDNTMDLKDIHAPLDYAPRDTPYDPSTLTEEYGLEKVNLHEKNTTSYSDIIAQAQSHKV